tara:strand:+ start:344 stop:559 length:216 start_codon:yes stop_codon:yes gene_type:complete
MSEKLDIKNIIEIERIRNILSHEADLLSLFELLISVANKEINQEKQILSLPLEPYEDPELSDHESDEDEIY